MSSAPPTTPRSVMAFFSSAFSGIAPKSPSAGKLELGGEEAPLKMEQDVVESCNLKIEGMTCSACVESIEGGLRDQAGIISIKVALLAGRASAEYDPSVWTPEKIAGEIEDMGFEVTVIPPARAGTVTLSVFGMTCGSCTSSVEKGLEKLPGVTSVAVVLEPGSAKVEFETGVVGVRQIVERIEEMGFDAVLSDADNATQLRSLGRTREVQEWRDRFRMALAFALPVFIISMVLPKFAFLHPILHLQLCHGIYLDHVVLLALSTPVQFWLGNKFYINAYKSLSHGSATMDVLVALGTSSAYFYSVFVMIAAMFNSDPEFRPMVFFDTSTMLIMFVSLGRFLENRAKGKTSAALTDLMALAPSMATIYTDAACTEEKRIATELVQVGDIVKLVPGDKVPADGTVVRGTSSIDESAVTGEPVPVLKQAGDAVIGGTVNGLGTFDMVVTRAGKDTALAQIVKLVEEAQTSKAPIQAFADKAAGYLVPTVISLALLTFLGWMGVSYIVPDANLPAMFHRHGASKLAVCLQMCISVVVVACPCALGLGTPTAIMVGTGVGAKNGILIKGGRALEASRHIKRVVVDKTGTVTEGRLAVAHAQWAAWDADAYGAPRTAAMTPSDPLAGNAADGATPRAALLAMVAAAEARSEHPLAKAVATYGKEALVGTGFGALEASVDTFESVTGAGVKALCTVTGAGPTVRRTIRVGNARFVTQDDHDPRIPAALAEFERQETELGRTVIYVSMDTPSAKAMPVIAFSLTDAPKRSSARAIQALQEMGVQVDMMTGDGTATALAIAREVGIKPENVYATMSPQGKAAKVLELMEKHGEGVAMVGDGINDSPALAAASVGIALSSGTSVAVEAADIVLMRSDLLDVVAALHLSRAIFRVIRRNLIWACLYNALGVPLAMGLFLPAGVYLHPMMAGAAMAFSSVSVVSSSLMLRWWKRPAQSVMPGDVVRGETMWESARETLGEAWDAVRAWVRPQRSSEGYKALPMEMTASTPITAV